mgnify:FL=1|tara:strand:- start:529 stop:864 length:336 start_codon:yes stop_codon:yes gene_type:complete
MAKRDKIKKSVRTLKINPASKSDLLKFGFKVEDLTKEVEVGGYTYDHLKPKGKKDGGAMKKKKFPDLSGDGKVTKKDILMGRGVIKKKDGGPVRGKARGMGAATKGGGYNI